MRWARMFLIAALTFAAMAPWALVTRAVAAQTAVESGGLHATYEVLYRYDCHDRWRSGGHYDSHREAHHAADHLRHQGYEVRVHHHS